MVRKVKKSAKGSAAESAAVIRARVKLKKKFDKQDARSSKKALDLMREAIHIWLNRHKEERIPLEDKSIELFDSNKHPARTKSVFVADLLKRVTKETKESHQIEKLVGRITK